MPEPDLYPAPGPTSVSEDQARFVLGQFAYHGRAKARAQMHYSTA